MVKEIILGLAVAGMVKDSELIDKVQAIYEAQSSVVAIEMSSDMVSKADIITEVTEDTQEEEKEQPIIEDRKKQDNKDNITDKKEALNDNATDEEETDVYYPSEDEEDLQYSKAESFDPLDIVSVVKVSKDMYIITLDDGTYYRVDIKANKETMLMPKDGDIVLQADTIVEISFDDGQYDFTLTDDSIVSVVLPTEEEEDVDDVLIDEELTINKRPEVEIIDDVNSDKRPKEIIDEPMEIEDSVEAAK